MSVARKRCRAGVVPGRALPCLLGERSRRPGIKLCVALYSSSRRHSALALAGPRAVGLRFQLRRLKDLTHFDYVCLVILFCIKVILFYVTEPIKMAVMNFSVFLLGIFRFGIVAGCETVVRSNGCQRNGRSTDRRIIRLRNDFGRKVRQPT